MKDNKSILKMFSIIVFGYALIAFSANISAQEEDMPDSTESAVSEDSETGEDNSKSR